MPAAWYGLFILTCYFDQINIVQVVHSLLYYVGYLLNGLNKKLLT